MAMRNRTKTSRRARQSPTPANSRAAGSSSRRAIPAPLVEPFYVAVDRQFKTGHGTLEAAEKAALAIKKRYPQLYVSIYDTERRRHTSVQQPVATGNRNPGSSQARNNNQRRRASVATGRGKS
jgi:hypothetical protein